MKITIDFELDDTLTEGQNPEELRQTLKDGLIQGLGCLISDYPGGEQDFGLVYAALKTERQEAPDAQRMFNDFCVLLESEMRTLEFVLRWYAHEQSPVRRHETIIERGIDSARRSLAEGLRVPETCPRVAERLNS